MIKNQYSRLVEGGKLDLEQSATEVGCNSTRCM
jgi:hypothetical protein